MKKIIFNLGQDKIQGTLFYPAKKRIKYPAVLFIHGWTSSEKGYAHYSKALNKIGVACMTFDLRGHGDSDGDINTQSRQDFLDDVLAAYDVLAQSASIDKDDITVVGSSFGSYLASLTTQYRPVKRLILRVPANYPNGDLSETQIKHSNKIELLKWRFEVKDPEDTFALKALHSFNGEVLVVESENDKIIPHQTTENYLNSIRNNNKLSYVVMKGAPHGLNTPELRSEYLNLLISWLKPRLSH